MHYWERNCDLIHPERTLNLRAELAEADGEVIVEGLFDNLHFDYGAKNTSTQRELFI
jgi:hypothetical protein